MSKRTSQETIQQILNLSRQGESLGYISQTTGVGEQTVIKYLQQHGLWNPRGSTSLKPADSHRMSSDNVERRRKESVQLRQKQPVQRGWSMYDLCTYPVAFEFGHNAGKYCTQFRKDGSDLCEPHHQQREENRKKLSVLEQKTKSGRD